MLRDASGFAHRASGSAQPISRGSSSAASASSFTARWSRYRSGPLQMQRAGLRDRRGGRGRARCTPAASCPSIRRRRGSTQRALRALMKRLVDGYAATLVADPLPEALRARTGCCRRLRPRSGQATSRRRGCRSRAARRRLVFDDFLLLQLGLAILRQRAGPRARASHEPARRARGRRLRATLPFALTAAQERVWRRDPAGHGGAVPDAPAAPGRRRLRQDRGGGARRADRDRGRLPGGRHGAHRDPRRAAPA